MNFNFELWLRCFLSVYHLSFFLLYMLHIISPINENSNFFFALSCVCHNKGIFVYTNSKFIPEVTYFNQSLSKILYFRFFEIFLCIYMNLFKQCSVILNTLQNLHQNILMHILHSNINIIGISHAHINYYSQHGPFIKVGYQIALQIWLY